MRRNCRSRASPGFSRERARASLRFEARLIFTEDVVGQIAAAVLSNFRNLAVTELEDKVIGIVVDLAVLHFSVRFGFHAYPISFGRRVQCLESQWILHEGGHESWRRHELVGIPLHPQPGGLPLHAPKLEVVRQASPYGGLI